ncbi:MAG: hypothetical protein WBA25_08230 [Jannaschia sp.]
MSNIAKSVLVLATLTAIAGCAQRDDEVVIIEPAPIVVEPVSGKF